MDIVSLCPFVASTVVWQAHSGAFALTVMVKATFTLQQGTAKLANEQDPIFTEDRYHDEDPRRSVRVSCDVVPYKPRADVVLVGSAYAPNKQPARSVITRFRVGTEMDKSVEVFCDRAFRVQDGQVLEGKRFSQMPLVWERAMGGPETANPVGKRSDGPSDAYGTIMMANLQSPEHFAARHSGAFAPTCYAPIAPTWPGRTQRLGRLARAILESAWNEKPLAVDLDPAFFLVAPADQNVEEIRPNEQIILDNLHPDHPHLVMNLPGMRPRAIVDRATGERQEIALVGDTLIVDTDRCVCSVVWRGRIGLRSADEAGRISVLLDGGIATDAPEEPQAAKSQSRPDTHTQEEVTAMTTIEALIGKPTAPVMPFARGAKPGSSGEAARSSAALPFSGSSPPGLTRPPETPPPQKSERAPVGPITIIPTESLVPTAPGSRPQFAPPPMIAKPPVREPVSPAVVPSSWSAPIAEKPPAATVGQMMAQAQIDAPKAKEPAPSPVIAVTKEEPDAIVDEVAAKRGWAPVNAKSGESSKGAPLAPNAALMSAAAVSDAAAGERPKGTSNKRGAAAPVAVIPPKAVIELLWFDPAAVPRIRRNNLWKDILGQIKSKTFEDELSGDSPPEKRQEARDKRDVAGLLARGDSTDMAGLNLALANAVTEDGTFISPLVLLAGELEFPFDELETLKATVAAMTPLASGDKPLREQLDTTEELLKTPWLKGASGIAEGLTAKLKEVFGRGNRVLPPRYLEGHTERMLIEQRAYQKRMVLGKMCIRSLLHLPGQQGGIPVYLPESLGQELPAFQRFAVRMLAEVRGKVDQYEVQEVALRGAGLGRVITTKRI